MSTPAVYRFLPFTRRGLVAELTDSSAAASGPLPFRASISLEMTLSGGNGTATTSTTIAGPGDVMGIDLAQIVRLTPRRNATNVEPNYLVAVDFDDPDFPWMLTPCAANPNGQLRPWIVLIVVEDRPGVSIGVPAGAPLAQLTIEHGAQRELPSLSDSWAWAHTQLLVAEGSGATAAPALKSDPDRHVSRLLCPRRLRPNTRWIACLVPAFDAGKVRGFGHVPADAPLRDAWTDEDAVTLPVYFHWEFGTGPDGDFESLARRLHPFVITDDDGTPKVGTVEMHIGAAGGPMDLPPGHPQHIVEMDGALRALQNGDGVLADIPAELRDPLGTLLDSIADPSGTDPDDGAVGPPLYGAWAVNRFHVAGDNAGWFAEANLDPRARVAAGLGAEVVRREQEDLMTACWQQVGAVLRANALLSRARLSIEASTFLHAKTFDKLAADRVMTFAGPLTDRTPMGTGTVKAAIVPTSFPDASIDPALRRLVAPTGRFVRKSSLRIQADPVEVGTRFVTTLAGGTDAVDPTDFVPAGVAPPAGATTDLGDVPRSGARLALRGDIRKTGMLTDRHVDAIRTLMASPDHSATVHVDPVITLKDAAVEHDGTSGFVTRLDPRSHVMVLQPIDVTTRGSVSVRTAPNEPNQVIARLDTGVSAATVTGEARRLPKGTLRGGAKTPVIRSGPNANDLVVGRGVLPIVHGAGEVDATPIDGVLMPPLQRDATVISRFEAAINDLSKISAIDDDAPTGQVVAFPLAGAAAALAQRCDPAVAHTQRVGTMVNFGSVTLNDIRDGAGIGGLAVAPTFDRIMAYPELNDPGYEMLARYDRDRLLPGVDSIPPDSVTLLETNPRFIAAYLAGLNHELNRELLWRRYPTDQRGTPVRRFWDRVGGATDVPPMHQWLPLTRTLADVAGGESNLVLLIRGDLFRRYPNTVVLAIKAVDINTPGTRDEDVQRPIFSGFLEPDITFFGFDLIDADVQADPGYFFALQEQVTEPRFGLDETPDPTRTSIGAWRSVAWTDVDVPPGSTFTRTTVHDFAMAKGLDPAPTNGAAIADAMFQNPIQVLVHGRPLTIPADNDG